VLRMEYPEVQKVNGSMTDACERLVNDFGYKHIGTGRHAHVFAKDEHVLKVGYVNDDNYFNYVRMVGLCSANPHLPHILSADVYDMNPDEPTSAPYYIVKMERLALDFSGAKKPDYWQNLLGVDAPRVLDERTIDTISPRTAAMIEVKNILTHLYQCYDARYDVGSEIDEEGYITANVMWRGKTAVFTDPVV
jgi:hypothetical protein